MKPLIFSNRPAARFEIIQEYPDSTKRARHIVYRILDGTRLFTVGALTGDATRISASYLESILATFRVLDK